MAETLDRQCLDLSVHVSEKIDVSSGSGYFGLVTRSRVTLEYLVV